MTFQNQVNTPMQKGVLNHPHLKKVKKVKYRIKYQIKQMIFKNKKKLKIKKYLIQK